MNLEGLGDFLERAFSFITSHGIAGSFAILWVFTMAIWWLERDERKSAQAELKQVSKETIISMNETSIAIDKMADKMADSNGMFERLLNTKSNGRGRR
jgi:hypothetical protein